MPRISRAGTLTEAARPQAGLSLIELLAAMVIIGIILAIVYPRISGISEAYLKSDSRRVAALITYLSESASSKKLYYRVWFDLTNERLRVESSVAGKEYAPSTDPALRELALREGVEIEDIVTPGLGKTASGEVSMVFAPASGEPFTLHLKAGESSMTVSYNPYTGKVRTEAGYV